MHKIFLLSLLFLGLMAEAQSSISSIADSLYATGNYVNAINYYARQGSQKSSLQIARAYNAIGNYEKAVVQYEATIIGESNLQIASFELGKLYLRTKRFDEARKLFSALNKIDAKNPEYLYYLGESFRELEQISSSLVGYKSAVEVDSTHLRSLFQLGKYFVVKQERNEALKYLDMGLQFYENDVSLINLKALALFNNDEYLKALPLFERLIELGELKEHVYGKLAYCYFKDWQFEKAKKTYHTLIQMDEEDPDPYFNLGRVFLKERQIDSARFYIKKSIQVQDPSFNREYRSLAGIAREQEELESAFEYYRLAHKEDSTDYISYYQMCALADQLYKDPKSKLEYYENFIDKFGTNKPYVSQTVQKRISKLKEEILFEGN